MQRRGFLSGGIRSSRHSSMLKEKMSSKSHNMWTEYCVYKSTSESFCFPNAEDTIICAKYELREWFNERMIRSFLGGRYGRKWITNSSEKSSINSSSHFHTLVVLGNCGLHCDEDCVFHVKSNFHEVVESNVSDFLNGKHSCTTFLRFYWKRSRIDECSAEGISLLMSPEYMSVSV